MIKSLSEFLGLKLIKTVILGVFVKIGLLKESHPDESRVALVPAQLGKLKKSGHEVVFESNAGLAAGYQDELYINGGASVASRAEVISSSDILFLIRAGSNCHEGFEEELKGLKEGCQIIGMVNPYEDHSIYKVYQEKKAKVFSLELIPRSTRAQSMDVLSSMANLAGYKAAILAGNETAKMFPLMMTAAGTIVPAKVFVLGVGVAGLQAIATAKRLGAVVTAYDVRPEVKEQVLSLGAKFAEIELDTSSAQGDNGYAKELDEEFYKKQREMLSGVLADSDVVITTAAIPGKKSPLLINKEMIEKMPTGSIIIDLAAERGGNSEGAVYGEKVSVGDVSIISPKNIAATLAYHASQLYSKNVENFFFNFFDKDGAEKEKGSDDIIVDTMVIEEGEMIKEKFSFLNEGAK